MAFPSVIFAHLLGIRKSTLYLIPTQRWFVWLVSQVYDIEIDKVNKPYLPLASGEFSLRTGLAIVGVSGILSLMVGSLARSPPLMATLVLSMVLGIGYSMDFPFLRWKKNAFFAACCVMMIRWAHVEWQEYCFGCLFNELDLDSTTLTNYYPGAS